MIRAVSILMVLVGAAFLALSFLPARDIWGNVGGKLRRKWFLILNLMAFFLLGYLFFDVVLFYNLPFPLELVTGGVFLGGAFFVFIIIHLSKSTIRARRQVEEEVTRLNESLEQRVAERTQELKSVSDFSRTVLDSIIDPIAIIDVETLRIVDTNQAFLREIGLPKDRVIGRTCFDITHHQASPCTLPHGACPLAKTLAGGDHATAHHIHWTALGEKRHVEVLTSPIRDETGRIVRAVHIQRDITERTRAEEDRLEYERKLLHAQKLESLGILAGGIAHDFNNLLAVILGNMELALMREPDDPQIVSGIEKAIQAGRHAANLTRQMLDYAGKGLFVLNDVSINDVVLQNADLFRTSVARTIRLEIAATPGLPPIKTDKGQIQQVIMNLLINAAEAIGPACGTISLRTGIRECDAGYLAASRLMEKPPAGRYIYVEVADTGCGMDNETQQRMFDPFFTTKFTGRGLGMAAVLGIVRSHKGAILVESAKGAGSTFRVLFPETGAAEAETPRRDNVAAPPPAPSKRYGTVLIVDDEEQVRGLCLDFVKHLGWEAIGVADGKQALAVCNVQNGIDLVILDLTMPDMDGVRTFHELRRIRPDMPVILSSGYSKEDMSKRFTDDRPEGFIQKPFQIHDLKEKITLVMRGDSDRF